MATNKHITEEQALQRLAALCSQGEHCQQELVEKMQKWEVPEDAQARIMEYLVKERYVDDDRYCRGMIHDKREYNHWGPRKIEQALWAKGIARETYAPLIAEVDDEKWIEILKPLLAQKRRSTKGKNDYEINQKLLRFALGRGFLYEHAKECISGDIEDEEW